jgi:hypothetical protein
MGKWVNIKGYENYKISDKGRVLNTNFNNTGKTKLLKIRKNHYGYNEVTLSKNNKRKFYLVLTLVAEHFLKKPAPDMIPIHLGAIDDDRVENIAYGYRSEMLHLMYKKGHRKVGKPTNNIISYKGIQYCSFSDMARDYNIEPKLLNKRINHGWTLEESLEIPVEREQFRLNKRLYEYNGKLYTVKELAELSGLNEKTIYKRFKRGWNVEETVEIPTGRRKNETKF